MIRLMSSRKEDLVQNHKAHIHGNISLILMKNIDGKKFNIKRTSLMEKKTC